MGIMLIYSIVNKHKRMPLAVLLVFNRVSKFQIITLDFIIVVSISATVPAYFVPLIVKDVTPPPALPAEIITIQADPVAWFAPLIARPAAILLTVRNA